MAEIRRHPVANHLRADPTAFVVHLRNGRVRRAGAGLAFWYRPGTAALAELPLDDREQALLFRARTADFQEVIVQATVNYRVADPMLAVTRVDFGIAPDTGAWNATPLETLGGLLTELAQQPAIELLGTMTMTEALARGIGPVRDRVAAALAEDARLAERGLLVTDVRVVAIRVDADLERALQTRVREQVQQEADRATYERRAMAVERERAISENELKNQIELARREEQLVDQQGRNEQLRAAEEAAANRVTTEAAAARRRLEAEAEADATRALGDARAAADAAQLGAFDGLAAETQLALTLRELAGNLPAIEHLTVTPDLLTQALVQLVGNLGAAAPAPTAGGAR
jgi:regulator of protease activity HflC (stomatin/prohibitin superfamily)